MSDTDDNSLTMNDDTMKLEIKKKVAEYLKNRTSERLYNANVTEEIPVKAKDPITMTSEEKRIWMAAHAKKTHRALKIVVLFLIATAVILSVAVLTIPRIPRVHRYVIAQASNIRQAQDPVPTDVRYNDMALHGFPFPDTITFYGLQTTKWGGPPSNTHFGFSSELAGMRVAKHAIVREMSSRVSLFALLFSNTLVLENTHAQNVEVHFVLQDQVGRITAMCDPEHGYRKRNWARVAEDMNKRTPMSEAQKQANYEHLMHIDETVAPVASYNGPGSSSHSNVHGSVRYSDTGMYIWPNGTSHDEHAVFGLDWPLSGMNGIQLSRSNIDHVKLETSCTVQTTPEQMSDSISSYLFSYPPSSHYRSDDAPAFFSPGYTLFNASLSMFSESDGHTINSEIGIRSEWSRDLIHIFSRISGTPLDVSEEGMYNSSIIDLNVVVNATRSDRIFNVSLSAHSIYAHLNVNATMQWDTAAAWMSRNVTDIKTFLADIVQRKWIAGETIYNKNEEVHRISERASSRLSNELVHKINSFAMYDIGKRREQHQHAPDPHAGKDASNVNEKCRMLTKKIEEQTEDRRTKRELYSDDVKWVFPMHITVEAVANAASVKDIANKFHVYALNGTLENMSRKIAINVSATVGIDLMAAVHEFSLGSDIQDVRGSVIIKPWEFLNAASVFVFTGVTNGIVETRDGKAHSDISVFIPETDDAVLFSAQAVALSKGRVTFNNVYMCAIETFLVGGHGSIDIASGKVDLSLEGLKATDINVTVKAEGFVLKTIQIHAVLHRNMLGTHITEMLPMFNTVELHYRWTDMSEYPLIVFSFDGLVVGPSESINGIVTIDNKTTNFQLSSNYTGDMIKVDSKIRVVKDQMFVPQVLEIIYDVEFVHVDRNSQTTWTIKSPGVHLVSTLFSGAVAVPRVSLSIGSISLKRCTHSTREEECLDVYSEFAFEYKQKANETHSLHTMILDASMFRENNTVFMNYSSGWSLFDSTHKRIPDMDTFLERAETLDLMVRVTDWGKIKTLHIQNKNNTLRMFPVQYMRVHGLFPGDVVISGTVFIQSVRTLNSLSKAEKSYLVARYFARMVYLHRSCVPETGLVLDETTFVNNDVLGPTWSTEIVSAVANDVAVCVKQGRDSGDTETFADSTISAFVVDQIVSGILTAEHLYLVLPNYVDILWTHETATKFVKDIPQNVNSD